MKSEALSTKNNQDIKHFIEQYRQTVQIQACVVPNQDINKIFKYLKAHQLVYEIPNHERILVHDTQSKVILIKKSLENEEEYKALPITEVSLELGYKNFTTQQIFNWFTDSKNCQEKEGQKSNQLLMFPNSFETVGHMAHYNLTPQQCEFKEVIGEITLLKCLNIKTVVNKTQKLHNVYRTPTLEHMAGEVNYLVHVREQGVTFQLDFQKVYWCSRLQQERDRLLQQMKPKELLADIFCGVGPLSVRAAKKGLFVIANDLNPYCHEYLNINCKLNKVQQRVKCWNMCAREAMRKIYKEFETYEAQFQYPDHIYMNLPVDAIEFLDVLVDYSYQMKTHKMPLVHVNCFVVADSDQKSKELLQIRINKVLPGFEKEQIQHMHHIKNVTVIMRMYCLSIRLRHHEQGNPIKQFPKQQEGEKQVEDYDEIKKKVKTD